MSKKNYLYTQRRKKRPFFSIADKAKAFWLILFFGLMIVGGAFATCNHNEPSPNKSYHGRYRDLYAVVLPQDVSSRVIDYEGFTVNFNEVCHQPNFVVWELTAAKANGNLPRRSRFAADPEVNSCATLQDYRNSGYDRGHMAPAADMKWSETAMDQSHFLTNICPQDHSLNAGKWNSLEQNCRSWAQRDSLLIIIAGPVLSDRLSRTIGESHIPVPERFFKILLAPAANPPRAIAFMMPNSEVREPLESMVMTVDQIEEITGFDFFSALPDDIENEVESTSDLRWWARR